MFRLRTLAGSRLRKLVLAAALGVALGAATQERTVAECPKDICEQDIIWDDCVDSPDPPSNNQCNFVGGECHNQECELN